MIGRLLRMDRFVRIFKNGGPTGTMDMLIAGHAKAEGLVLVTNNVREFERVWGLDIENWAEE